MAVAPADQSVVRDGSDSPPQRTMSPATTNRVTQNEVNAKSWHRFLWVPLAFMIPGTLVSISYIAQMVRERQAHMALEPEKYDWTYPQLSDLWTTFVGLVVLLTLRCTVCPYVFTPLGDMILPTLKEKKGKWTAAARADRVQRFSVCLFKLCFFLCMTVYGYLTLRDQDFLPPQLGGSGAVANAWTGWPYSSVSWALKRYYLLELSYHTHSLVFHLFTIHRNDFVEMTLHHTCAVVLVTFSYFANWVRVGSLVLFLHDIADVTAYSVKAVVDTRYTYVTLSAYAALLAAWGYTRLYVFPFCVIPHAVVPGEVTVAWITGYVMIWTLQALHVYWYALFLIMGYRFAVSGKTVDIQQKAGEEDGSYVDYHKTHAAEERNGHADESNGHDETEQTTEQPRARKASSKKSKRAE